MSQLSDEDILEIYDMIKKYYENHLAYFGVRLPKLKKENGEYTKDALVLVYLAQGYPQTRAVSKKELTDFLRSYYSDVTDVQQARHLGAQKGWYIISGTRGNGTIELKAGEYQLVSLEKPYPGFRGHRVGEIGEDYWEKIKLKYNGRCATCGSEEGKPHLHWPNTLTRLQKAHIDPRKPLGPRNIIPQCEKCNRADRNNWVYDDKGRVIKVANPKVIKRCDREVRWEVYKILYREFKGVNPYDEE